MTIIGAIPVKEVSVRFPGKNFMKVGNEFLINLAIRRLAPHVDRIIISTDAPLPVNAVVKQCKVKFDDGFIDVIMRGPRTLNGDLQSTEPIAEAIAGGQWCTEDTVVITQVTTPLIRSQTVERCLAIWQNSRNIDLVVTTNPNRQPNGGVYICKAKHLYESGSLYHGNVHVHRIPYEEGIDIDYPHQLAIAEAICRGDLS